MTEKVEDEIGKKALQRLTLFEPDSPKSVCTTLPEPSIGVIACDRIASSTQGVFHYVPDPPEDSIGVRALSKLVPKDEVPELRSAENVSEYGTIFSCVVGPYMVRLGHGVALAFADFISESSSFH